MQFEHIDEVIGKKSCLVVNHVRENTDIDQRGNLMLTRGLKLGSYTLTFEPEVVVVYWRRPDGTNDLYTGKFGGFVQHEQVNGNCWRAQVIEPVLVGTTPSNIFEFEGQGYRAFRVLNRNWETNPWHGMN